MAVATIAVQGTDPVPVDSDTGIETFQDLAGTNLLRTAGAGVNTLFPVAARNAGADPDKIELAHVAESALAARCPRKLAPAVLGGVDDEPAAIETAGGEPSGGVLLAVFPGVRARSRSPSRPCCAGPSTRPR